MESLRKREGSAALPKRIWKPGYGGGGQEDSEKTQKTVPNEEAFGVSHHKEKNNHKVNNYKRGHPKS